MGTCRWRSRLCYIDYSGHNFSDLFNFNDITADKGSSNSDNESNSESNEIKNEVVPSKKMEAEKNRKWPTLKLKLKLKKRSECYAVKDSPFL